MQSSSDHAHPALGESSSICNLRCVMCPDKDMRHEDLKFMDLALFKKIVDEAKGTVNDMYLHHRGEPFTNPALFDMIAYARADGINKLRQWIGSSERR